MGMKMMVPTCSTASDDGDDALDGEEFGWVDGCVIHLWKD